MRQGRTILSLLLVSGVFAPIHAVERALIDFTTYNENVAQVVERDQELYEQLVTENPDMDIRNFGWPEFSFEADDWNLENWKVELNASADTTKNNMDSLLKNTPSQEYGNVLGVRLRFEPWANPFWGQVKFPFYFAPVYTDGTFISENEQGEDNGLAVGLLVNVGQIKNVRSWVYGLNYNYSYGVTVVNEKDQVLEFGMGSIFHEGWRRVAWNNSEYLTDEQDLVVYKNALYPYSYPYIKFDSLSFYKPAGMKDENFIAYVKDVTVEFDLATVREDQDINDEAVWQIIATDTLNRKIIMSKIIAEELLLKRKIQKLREENEDANAAQADDAAAAQ